MMDDQVLRDDAQDPRWLKVACFGLLALLTGSAVWLGDGAKGLSSLATSVAFFQGKSSSDQLLLRVTPLPTTDAIQEVGDNPPLSSMLAMSLVPKPVIAEQVEEISSAPSAEETSTHGVGKPRHESTRGEETLALPASVARAVSVVFSKGRQVGRGEHYDVRLRQPARKALLSVGVSAPPRSASASEREAALIEGLSQLSVELGSLEGAIACLRIERALVESALDLAFGANLASPEVFDGFGPYLPSVARSRAEGPTRRVMALAIGYEMEWPVPEVAKVSSGFGMRVHPVLGDKGWHYGTDLVVDVGTPIRAVADGQVVFSRRDAVNGKFVKLEHGYGFTSAYVHNSKLLVKEGQKVRKGQVIAKSGSTGRATGPHLHFQIELDNRPIDPESFRERQAPRAHRQSVEAEAIGEAELPR
ncbi:MAG: M23 family metallopeptidase [Myxococcales bacterium]|nr:M23 family metallopeptidase [Myxococcales bacterium]